VFVIVTLPNAETPPTVETGLLFAVIVQL